MSHCIIYTSNSKTAAPTKVLFGSLFHIMQFRDSFWFWVFPFAQQSISAQSGINRFDKINYVIWQTRPRLVQFSFACLILLITAPAVRALGTVVVQVTLVSRHTDLAAFDKAILHPLYASKFIGGGMFMLVQNLFMDAYPLPMDLIAYTNLLFMSNEFLSSLMSKTCKPNHTHCIVIGDGMHYHCIVIRDGMHYPYAHMTHL